MSVLVSDADIASFERDGVIAIRGAVPEEALLLLERAIDRHLQGPAALNRLLFGDAGFFTRPNVWKTDADFFELVQTPIFAEIAARLLRSERINLLQDQIFVKRSSTERVFDWHQDLSYSPVAGERMLSLWMACGPVTRETSGVQFLRGSHRAPLDVSRPSVSPIELLLGRRSKAD